LLLPLTARDDRARSSRVAAGARLCLASPDEAFGHGGREDGDEADADQHHHHGDATAEGGRGVGVAVAHGRHRGDRPPHAVPDAQSVSIGSLLDGGVGSAARQNGDDREHGSVADALRGRRMMTAALTSRTRRNARNTRRACRLAGRNGGVRMTMAISSGCDLNQRARSGATASMSTASATNASQVVQLRSAPRVSQGSPALPCSIAMAGMVRSAATSSGHCNRCSMRSARASTGVKFDGGARPLC
jgi:hypothetical protein